MSEPLSAERLAEIRATVLAYWRRMPTEVASAAQVLLVEVDRLRAENARLQALTAEPGPSRWFSAAHDERHGTDPGWDGTGE